MNELDVKGTDFDFPTLDFDFPQLDLDGLPTIDDILADPDFERMTREAEEELKTADEIRNDPDIQRMIQESICELKRTTIAQLRSETTESPARCLASEMSSTATGGLVDGKRPDEETGQGSP